MKVAEKAFTTFQVARLCGVFHTTVINWVNKGKLKAHQTPGRHRRIVLPDLIDFMNRFEMPIPADLQGRAKRVLVVEDDPAMQRMLRRALEPLPIELQTCSGGLEALMAIGKEAPDLLVLDIRIPQVNGVEVCRVLRSSELTKPIKIIAITGEPLPAESETYLCGEVDGFFQKPLPTADLKALVTELLDLEDAGTPAAR